MTASQISLWLPRTNPSLESGIYLFFAFSHTITPCLWPGATSRLLFQTISGTLSNRVSFSFSFGDSVCYWVLVQHSVLVMLRTAQVSCRPPRCSLWAAPRWASQCCHRVTARNSLPCNWSLWVPMMHDTQKKAHFPGCPWASVQGTDLVKLLPLQALMETSWFPSGFSTN